VSETDVRLLDEYRRSFAAAYESVVLAVGEQLGLQPTGRPAKSTTSVSEKLRRESIRLTQIQDIAGCRLVVADVPAQKRVVQELTRIFPVATIVDRRRTPSHGYRAVHIIVLSNQKLIEIQVRTALRHTWAELSEKFSDVVDPAIKYGGGHEAIRALLAGTSELVAVIESSEQQLADVLASCPPELALPDHVQIQIAQAQDGLRSNKEAIARLLEHAIALVPNRAKGETGAISD